MCDSNPNGATLVSECRADFVLVNPEKDVLYFQKATVLAEGNGPPFAQIITVNEPSGEWLEESLLAPLSDEQRTAFDRDGIVLLLQHPCRLIRPLPIARIAADAVCFGYEQLDGQGVPNPDPRADDARETFNAARAARTNEIISRLDRMDDADRVAFFIKAFRDRVVGTEDRRVIDLYVNDQPQELQAALTEAWSQRRDHLQAGGPAVRPQAE